MLPRIVPLGGGQPPGSGVGAEGAIPHMVALHGEDDVSIRSYRDGDDLRRIHWPATAKTGELMVRQEDRPARRRAAIVLDSRARGHHGSGTSGSFEWAVTACASVAAHLLDQGYAVHLISDETAEDSRASSAMEVDPLLDVLAMAETGSDDQFGDVLQSAHPVTASGGLVLAVVTDLDEELARRVASLRQPGGTALAIVLDPDGFTATRRHRAGGQRRARLRARAARRRLDAWPSVGAGDDLPSVWGVLSGGDEPGGCGMSRGRLADSLIAGACSAVVAWPLTTLFTPSTWIRPTLAMVFAVVVVGIAGPDAHQLLDRHRRRPARRGRAGRRLDLRARPPLARPALPPTPCIAFNNLLVDARETIQNYAAPAPDRPRDHPGHRPGDRRWSRSSSTTSP